MPSDDVELVRCDVALVGAGIMSATMAMLLHALDPSLTLVIFEREARAAQESSNPWNNAGTGHSALCELNYTAERADGSVDIAKAVHIDEQFQVSRQFWAHFVEAGVLGEPSGFISQTPHMTLVHGDDDIAFLNRRFDALKPNPLFASMRFSAAREQIGEWAPLITEGRGSEPIAATFDAEGTDVNFGELTRRYLAHLQADGVRVYLGHEVTSVTKLADGSWSLRATGVRRFGPLPGRAKTSDPSGTVLVKAAKVFVGAGGYALPLLQKARLPEIAGYGLFPISGEFLVTNDPAIVNRHNAKVYGKASVGAPPMSVPHLDARVIDGERWVLFGPFAGQSPKFLKDGSVLDLPKSLRIGNLAPMLTVAKDNLDLVRYLMGQLAMTPERKTEALREFMPTASPHGWTLTTGGQRAQIIKPQPSSHGGTRPHAIHGTLEFGTEAIVSADGSMQAVLGASPGASTAVPIMLDILARAWANRLDEWTPKLQQMIPTYGTPLADDASLAHATISRTAEILGIEGPAW